MVLITFNIQSSQTINIILFQNFWKLTISIKMKTKVCRKEDDAEDKIAGV